MTDVLINDPSDGIYDDGEWISWEWINSQLNDEQDPEDLCERRSPPSVLELTRVFLDLVSVAQEYKDLTGRYLEIWGELGELYAEIRHGLVRHPKHFAGSDGTIGVALVEVKTISPEKKKDRVYVKRAGNFEKLLVVRVSEDFLFSSKLFERGDLKEGASPLIKARWTGFE
ncbi:hypothetical protein [Noviluteimonas dokdonensis]|uniref:hypothetical protein n=1 Tax=Noviluteimonas dokdonensis TaxID=414050 RepID=UPI00056B897E|nr:hypothetical protein [Lysobacter dokdonensis]